jgi:hypothetical protein
MPLVAAETAAPRMADAPDRQAGHSLDYPHATMNATARAMASSAAVKNSQRITAPASAPGSGVDAPQRYGRPSLTPAPGPVPGAS